ncbi:polyamine deacetylase HDAC10 isoform X2 [Erpetoichthys calabaricus]|uniref:Histone deacetylase 10 n=1 Tax=Erpetoichthys calabaricus TaxID=27687 RepID=A0A8C4RL24_ERPCA|nr:polyamine deacetylase HDAC10 isoform X2 [Erpetoichthys calabaricus]
MVSGTALIYDEEMTRYRLLWDYPVCSIEVPERLSVSYSELQIQGLVERCISVPVREATEEEILLAHSQDFLEAIKTTQNMDVEQLKAFASQFQDVYFHQNIYHCAKLALGATLQLVDAVMTKKVRNGIALVRPPGHHSQHSAANGFCIFNNVAIAALYAKKMFDLKRILIVDWDIHHGQGTQYFFEDDPSVLYFSWHRYENQEFWPNLPESDYSTVGKGKGAGFNVNVPWNKIGMQNSDYLSVFFHILLPMAYEFNPELVLISAGFDSAINDPEGKMCATPACFAHLTHLLMSLAEGKICAVLEGGYDLHSLSHCICHTVKAFLGDPVPHLLNISSPCDSALESIQNVRAVHQQHWAFLRSLPISMKHQNVNDDKKLEQFCNEEIHTSSPNYCPLPPKRTAVALLGEKIELPDRCLKINLDSVPSDEIWSFKDSTVEGQKDSLHLQKNLCSVMMKIFQKEVQNGLAAVPCLLEAIKAVLSFCTTCANSVSRILVLYLGDKDYPVSLEDDGNLLLIQMSTKKLKGRESKYHIPIFLPKEGNNVKGVLHALFSLILPVAYMYNPDLVVTALSCQSGVDKKILNQLTSLLQGLAEGQLLCLIHDPEVSFLEDTICSLLGDPILPVTDGVLQGEAIQEVEQQRQRLQEQWGILKTQVTRTEYS